MWRPAPEMVFICTRVRAPATFSDIHVNYANDNFVYWPVVHGSFRPRSGRQHPATVRVRCDRVHAPPLLFGTVVRAPRILTWPSNFHFRSVQRKIPPTPRQL